MTQFMSRVSRSVFLSLVASSFCMSALAATTVTVEPKDWDAIRQLIKPDQTSLRLDGRKGYFVPGSQIQFMGVMPDEFDIDLGSAGDLADVQFNNLRTNTYNLAFEDARIRYEIGFADQDKAIRTSVGSVNFRGASLVGWLKPVETLTGTVTFVQDGCEVRGSLTGTGLIGPSTIAKLKATMVSTVTSKLEALLAKPSVPESVEKGLVKYAQFSQNIELIRYVPTTLKIAPTGLTYQSE